MIKLLAGVFKPDIQYKIVEVEKTKRLGHIDPEIHKSVASLSIHPGFRYLLKKLAVEQAMLEGEIKSAPLKDVKSLQAGIYWAGWLDRQLKFESALAAPHTTVSPTQEEIDAFNQINAQLQVVGQ